MEAGNREEGVVGLSLDMGADLNAVKNWLKERVGKSLMRSGMRARFSCSRMDRRWKEDSGYMPITAITNSAKDFWFF